MTIYSLDVLLFLFGISLLCQTHWGQTHCNHNHRILVNLITRTTALFNSMKLSHAMWGHPGRVGHGGEVWHNVVHWRREWQTTSVFYLENPMNSMKRQNDRILKEELPGQQVPNMLLEISGEITPERMKGWSQSKKNTQLWMWLVIEARSDAVKSNIA